MQHSAHSKQSSARYLSSGIAHYPPGSDFGPRYLQSYELVWLLSGTAHYHQKGSDSLTLTPQQLLCCQPDTEDGFTWDSQQTTSHGFIHFQITAPEKPLPLIYSMSNESILVHLLNHLIEHAPNPDLRNQVHLSLNLIVTILTSGSDRQYGVAETGTRHPRIKQLFDILYEFWRGESRLTPITTDEVARRCQLSRTHLARICQQQLEMKPQEFIRLVRLDHALSLLTRSNATIQNIADDCGFESPYHFSRCFKEEYGQSPRSIRQAVATGAHRPASRLTVIQFNQRLAQENAPT